MNTSLNNQLQKKK